MHTTQSASEQLFWHECGRKMTLDRRGPLTEDSFDRRRPPMEDDLRWKTTLIKDIFDRRRHLTEDDL